MALTQHYSWDEVYARELENYAKSSDDEGTVWFEENGAEDAILSLLDQLVETGLLARAEARVLDLGCGNGHMLFTLRQGEADEPDSAWTGAMVGIDYSDASIQLAMQIAQHRQQGDTIDFQRWDLLAEEPGTWYGTGFNLILDKGTFDAISLMAQSDNQRHPCELYCERVVALLRPDDMLVITSCNWTKSELLSWFAAPQQEGKLRYVAEARYPSFTFGGRKGQSIVTLAFIRQST